MITLHGIPASPGVAIGPAWLYQKVQLAAYEELSRLTAQAEQRRFDCAVQEARAQLDRLYEKTVREAGEAAAQIFDIHKMMMEDLDYLESVEDNITNQLYTAEHAVACAGQEFAEMFASMDDEVMRARSADIRDITQRLLQVLTGGQSQALEESSVVCAHDLFPSDTMQLEREHVMAFVTELGSHVSHSAILARTMGIPAVVGVGGLVEALSAASGTIVVDGSQGLVILDADEQTLADYSARRQAYLREQTDLQVYRDLPSRTKDGLELEICANIAYVTDADNAAAVRADGVGLMRSEFLYMNADSAPDEDTQFAAYRAVLEKLEGKRVVVRTLDIGADKVPPLAAAAAGGKPRHGLAGGAHVPGSPGHVPHSAAGPAAGIALWPPGHYVPHDRGPGPASPGQGPAGGVPPGAGGRAGSPGPGHRGGHDGGGSLRRHPGRPVCPGGGFLLYRDQ